MSRVAVLLKRPYIADDGLEVEGEVISPYLDEVRDALTWVNRDFAEKSIVVREDDGHIYVVPMENIAALNIVPEMQKGTD